MASTLLLLAIFHFYLLVLLVVGSLGLFDWWQNNKESDTELVSVIRRIMNDDLDGFLQIRKELLKKYGTKTGKKRNLKVKITFGRSHSKGWGRWHGFGVGGGDNSPNNHGHYVDYDAEYRKQMRDLGGY